MKIAIIGCGWLGERLAAHLTQKGHHVLATTTTPEKLDHLKTVAAEVHLLDFRESFNEDFLKATDVALFSMPVSAKSWLPGFQKLKTAFPKTLFFSSTGIYPQEYKVFSETDTENMRPDLAEAERMVLEKYPKTTVFRLGGLMGDERKMQNFFKNRKVSDPHKAVNHIHFEDIIKMVEVFLKSGKSSDIYNIVAPEHPSIAEILGFQGGQSSAEPGNRKQRIISGEHFIQNFNYKFRHPNPKDF